MPNLPHVNPDLMRLFEAVNRAENPADLRQFGFSQRLATRIIKIRNQQHQRRFASLLHLIRMLDNPVLTRRYLDEYLPQCGEEHPILLLPVRIEARVVGGDLRIRFYPDDVSIEKHDPRLTSQEVEAGRVYQEAVEPADAVGSDQPVNLDIERDAWRTLSARFGPTRAAWIREAIGEYDPGDQSKSRTKEWMAPPKLRTLPDRFAVYLYNASGQLAHEPIEGKLIPPDRRIVAGLEASALFHADSRWVANFDTAVDEGMAVSVPVSQLVFDGAPNNLSQIVVVGLSRATPEIGQNRLQGLLASHHFSHGLGFVDHGTPTNNLPEARSGYSSAEDHESGYDVEVTDPPGWDQTSQYTQPNAERLGVALGLGPRPEVLRHIAGAGDRSESYAGQMNAALWPATGDYFFRYMLDGSVSEKDLLWLGEHFRRFVRSGGPLPAIRIGAQPYGVLPVTRIGKAVGGGSDGWVSSDLDRPSTAACDQKLHDVLNQLYARWRRRADDPTLVPRIRSSDDPAVDPDQELLDVLSMQPVSVSVEARPFVDERFVAWILLAMRNRVFGPGTVFEQSGQSPTQWMRQWSQAWRDEQRRTTEMLGAIGDLAAERFEDDPLTKIFGWWNAQAVEDLTSTEGDDTPEQYLEALCAGDSQTPPNTLLHDMLMRSMTLETQTTGGTLVRDAICRLASSTVLEFFNSVTTPDAIVERIQDDPDRPPGPPRAYGIRPSLARRILEVRDALPGKRFESLAQIDAIRGVGIDTFHDIMHAFSDQLFAVDVDLLFRQTLDLFTHRLDAWYTSLATKRLASMRQQQPNGIHVGNYGYVEDLDLSGGDPQSEGYIHTPSAGQTAAATVLYNAFLTHPPAEDGALPFRINLTSERVRGGLRLLQGVREGQTLGAMLGYQFERGLHVDVLTLDRYIDDFRDAFPTVADKLTASSGESAEVLAARNVVDGTTLARAWRAFKEDDPDPDVAAIKDRFEAALSAVAVNHQNAVRACLDGLLDSLDAVGDLLMYEGVYQAVQGNYDAAGAALEAASGNAHPPEIEAIKTRVPASTLEHRVGVLFPVIAAVTADGPRGLAEPKLARWFDGFLGDLDQIGCSYSFVWRADDGAEAAPGREPININTATTEELALLLDIGTGKAQLIVNHREENGSFNAVAELEAIDGIGATTMERIRGRATVGNPVVTLDEMRISAIDLLYLSAVPLEGAETELEQRVRRIARSRDGLPYDFPIQLDLSKPVALGQSLEKAAEFARLTLDLATQATALQPGSLAPPADTEQAAYRKADFDEIHDRAKQAFDNLSSLQSELDGLLPPLADEAVAETEAALSLTDRALMDELLMEISQYGVPGAVPPGPDEAGLLGRCRAVLKEVTRRTTEAADLLIVPPDPEPELDPEAEADSEIDYGSAVQSRIEALRLIFGRGFVVMPVFEPAGVQNLLGSFDDLEVLEKTDHHRLRLWLQEEAEVHPPLERLDDWLMVAEAWSQPAPGDSDLQLDVAQLPWSEGQHWLSLADSERDDQERPREALSVIVLGAESLRSLEPPDRTLTAGLMIHRCQDRVQETEVNTSAGFHYDSPNAQAPQCLLLAVPAQRNVEAGDWSESDVEGIVRSAIDLAKIRAVDLDALSGLVDEEAGEVLEGPDRDTGLGGILPSLFLPADPGQPGWARQAVMGSFEDWLEMMLVQDLWVEFQELDLFQTLGYAIEHEGLTLTAVGNTQLRVGGFQVMVGFNGFIWLRVIVSGQSGLRIRLPSPVPAVRVTTGWIGGERENIPWIPSEQENILAFDQAGNPIEANVRREIAPTTHEVYLDEAGNETHGVPISRYRVSGDGIAEIEIQGHAVVQRVITYKYSDS